MHVGKQMIRVLILIVGGVVCATLPDQAIAQQRYNIVDLGTLDDKDKNKRRENANQATRSAAFSINNLSEVVGFSTEPTGDYHAFLYRNGKIEDLDNQLGRVSWAYGITDAGVVLANARTDKGKKDPILTTPGGIFFNFGEGIKGAALGISNSGAVVGFLERMEDGKKIHRRAFLFRDGRLTDLGVPMGGEESDATAVNDAGQVVGHVYQDYHDSKRRAVFYHNGSTTSLGSFGGEGTTATDINSRGEVVGHSQLKSGEPHAFLYANEKLIDIIPGNRQSLAYAVNSSGQIVGAASNGSSLRAFLYSGGERGTVIDLNQQIAAGSGWVLTEARDINDKGEIVGSGVIRGEQRAFMLTPR